MENLKKLNLANKLIVIARSMDKVGDLILSRFDLTMRTYEILINIDNRVNTTLELSKLMKMTPSSIAQKTKILEDKKFIKRIVGDKDKRIWIFSHTEKGHKIFEQVQHIWKRSEPHLYLHYSKKERQLIDGFLSTTDEHLNFVLNNKNKIDDFVDKNLTFKRGMKNERE